MKPEIIDEYIVCPYCMNKLGESWQGCCGEAGHGELAYELSDGELLTEREYNEQYPCTK